MTTTSGKFESVLRSTTHELWEHSGAEKTRGACPQERGGPRPQGQRPYGATPTPGARLLVHLIAPPAMTRNTKPTRSPHPEPPQARPAVAGGR